MPGDDLSSAQRAMVQTWERHTAAEFETKSIDATMATMTAEPVRTVGTNRIVDELIYTVDSGREPSSGLIERARGP